jgi:hypothetical protein
MAEKTDETQYRHKRSQHCRKNPYFPTETRMGTVRYTPTAKLRIAPKVILSQQKPVLLPKSIPPSIPPLRIRAISKLNSSGGKYSASQRPLPTDPMLPKGLANFGATCYANSTMQLFNAIPEFKEAILKSSSCYPLILGLQQRLKGLSLSGEISEDRLGKFIEENIYCIEQYRKYSVCF